MIIKIGEYLVNTDNIINIKVNSTNSVCVLHKGGHEKKYTLGESERPSDILQKYARTIVQVVPVKENRYMNAYFEETDENGEKIYSYENVDFLALCLDNKIRSLTEPSDNGIMFAEDIESYATTFRIEQEDSNDEKNIFKAIEKMIEEKENAKPTITRGNGKL